MFIPQNGKITLTQILLPVSITAFTLFIMLAYQTSQIMRERNNLMQARNGQNEAVEQAQRVQTQLDALAVGTLKLSEGGNKNAKVIIDRMKSLGITVNGGQGSTTATTPEPAPAKETPAPAPAEDSAE